MSARRSTLPAEPQTPAVSGLAAAAVRPFRVQEQTRLAVIVKATFQMVHRGLARPLPPAPVVTADMAWTEGAEPSSCASDSLSGGPNVRASPPVQGALVAVSPISGSLAAMPIAVASEAAPYLAKADVLLTGHARARGGQPASLVPVRLRVGLGSTVFIDKTLHIYGDRKTQSRSAPHPFTAMPLGYQRAWGGGADPDNPAGVDPRANKEAANVIDPRNAQRAAGFGPIAGHWPSRVRHLRNASLQSVQAPWPTLAGGFDWSYFQAAPPDQQTPYLSGGEWIQLEGFQPDLPRLETRLPNPTAEAWMVGPDGVNHPLGPLRADMLVIDADRGICSVVWRTSVQMTTEEALATARIVARVALPGEDAQAQEPQQTRREPPQGRREPPRRKSEPPQMPRATQARRPTTLVDASGMVTKEVTAALPFVGAKPRPASPPLETLDEEATTELRSALPFVTHGASPPSTPFVAHGASPPSTPFAAHGASPPSTPFVAHGASTPSTPFVAHGASSPSIPPSAQRLQGLPFVPHQTDPAPHQTDPAPHQTAPAPHYPSPIPSEPPLGRSMEPPSPWASVSAHPPPSRQAPSYALAPEPTFASPTMPVGPKAPSASPTRRRAKVTRPRLPAGERPPPSAPLIPPRKRRPSKVAADGLGAAFLRSAPTVSPPDNPSKAEPPQTPGPAILTPSFLSSPRY